MRQVEGPLASALKESWYFRMVGSGEGQSFHEQMEDSRAFRNPMTVAVTGAKRRVRFKKGSHKLIDRHRETVVRVAQQLVADLEFDKGRKVKVSGFANTNLSTAQARSEAVVEILLEQGVPETAIRRGKASLGNETSAGMNRRVEVVFKI